MANNDNPILEAAYRLSQIGIKQQEANESISSRGSISSPGGTKPSSGGSKSSSGGSQSQTSSEEENEWCPPTDEETIAREQEMDQFIGKHMQLTRHNLINSGNMGKVYMASRTTNNERVALKVEPYKPEKEQFYAMEYFIAMRISSVPNNFIAHHFRTVYATANAYPELQFDMIYYEMEFVEGLDLFDVSANLNMNFTSEEVTVILWGIAKGLSHMHALVPSIVHRDIKPENVMITRSGMVKLIDFGFADFTGPEYKRTTYCGTAEYIAPEVHISEAMACSTKEHGGYGLVTDVWSLGIVSMYLRTIADLQMEINLECNSPPKPFDPAGRLSLEGQENYIGARNQCILDYYKDHLEEMFAADEIPPYNQDYSDQYCDLWREWTRKCLEMDDKKRWSIDESLKHPYFKNRLGQCITETYMHSILKPMMTSAINQER